MDKRPATTSQREDAATDEPSRVRRAKAIARDPAFIADAREIERQLRAGEMSEGGLTATEFAERHGPVR